MRTREILFRGKRLYHGEWVEGLRSYVLIEIFGLSCKQVDEVERNKGFTDADFN